MECQIIKEYLSDDAKFVLLYNKPLVLNIFYIVLVQLQTSLAIKTCENPWKENLGLSGSDKCVRQYSSCFHNY